MNNLVLLTFVGVFAYYSTKNMYFSVVAIGIFILGFAILKHIISILFIGLSVVLLLMNTPNPKIKEYLGEGVVYENVVKLKAFIKSETPKYKEQLKKEAEKQIKNLNPKDLENIVKEL